MASFFLLLEEFDESEVKLSGHCWAGHFLKGDLNLLDEVVVVGNCEF